MKTLSMFRMLSFLLVCCATSVQADQIALLQSGLPETGSIRAVISEANGGYSVILTTGEVQTYSADETLLGRYSSRWLQTGPTSLDLHGIAVGRRHVVFRETKGLPLVEGTEQSGARPECRVERLSGGRDLTVFFTDRNPERWLFIEQEPDALGGFWALDENSQVFRYAADCRKDAIDLELSSVIAVSRHPLQAAAYVVDQEGTLTLAATDGVRWSLRLPDFGWISPVSVLKVIGDGVAVVSYLNSEAVHQWAGFDDLGNLLWIYQDAMPRQAYAFRQGVLIDSDQVKLLGPAGSIQWSEPVELTVIPTPINRWGNSHAVLPGVPVSHPTLDWADQTVSVELDTGEFRHWIKPREHRLAATLSDHQHLISNIPERRWDDNSSQRLYRLGTAPEPQPVALASGSVIETELGLILDDIGALAAVGNQDRVIMHVQDAQPAARPLLVVQRSDQKQHLVHRGLAANSATACLLVEIVETPDETGFIWRELALHCVDRRTGEPRFEPVVWTGRDGFLNPNMQDRIEILFYGPFPVGQLRAKLLSLDGDLLETDVPPGNDLVSDNRMVLSALFADSGHRVLVAAQRVGLLRPYEHENLMWGERGTFDFGFVTHRDRYHSPMVTLGHGKFAILARWRLGRPDGLTEEYELIVKSLHNANLRWAVPVDVSSENGLSVTASEQGFVVTEIADQELRVLHFDQDDGSLINQFHFPHWDVSALPTGQAAHAFTQVRAEGSQLGVATTLAGGTRVHWLSLNDGSLLATANTDVSAPALQSPMIMLNDRMTILGQANGPGHPGIAIAHLMSAPRQAAPEARISDLAGVWYHPSLTGQGWYFDVMHDVGRIFGAWFTFEPGDTLDHRGLRWYTAIGRFPGLDGMIDMTLYENTGGVFDSPPVTQGRAVGSMRLWQTIAGELQADINIESEGLRTGLDLKRLTLPNQQNGVQHWFDPATSGQGLLLGQPIDASGPLTAAWFTYEPANAVGGPTRQHWFTAFGSSGQTGMVREATLFRTTGGSLAMADTSNTQAVGSIRLTALACDRLLMEYQFDDSDLAGAFAGLSGTRTLQPASGCDLD